MKSGAKEQPHARGAVLILNSCDLVFSCFNVW